MSLQDVLLLAVGLGLLLGGAELLVRGAVRLASIFRVTPLVIGLTVVAYGTSAPELAVSVRAAWLGQAELAVGNVVGSNVFNVLVVLGAAALIAPLAVATRVVRLDVPLMIGVSLVFWLLAANGRVGRVEGLLLVVFGIGYTIFQIRDGRRQGAVDGAADAAPSGGGRVRAALEIAGGLVVLVLGARWLVAGAVAMSRAFGVSELVIGLTVIAAGTSLPEVATSLMAAARGQREIAVGNIVGSNVFNVVWVLGMAAAVAPDGVAVSANALRFDLPVMVAVALLCLPICLTGWVVDRLEGALFLVFYLAYVSYLVVAARAHPARETLGETILWIAVPLTLVVLAITAFRARRRPAG